MRTSLSLDRELAAQLDQAESLTREKKSTLIRLAVKAGLPLIVHRYQAERPEGYFAQAYEKADPERVRLENAYAKALRQKPDR